jgi:hypothetical protein
MPTTRITLVIDQCLTLINSNVGKQIYIDFDKLAGRKKTIRSYISNVIGHGYIKRIKRDVYEVIKPVDSTIYLSRSLKEFKLRTDEAAKKADLMVKFNNDPQNYQAFTRAEMRKELNKFVGSLVDSSIFKRSKRKGNVYLQNLHESGHVQRVGYGKYKVLKKIILKKRGVKKENIRFKDVSMIPSILNSSPDGITMEELDKIYQRITSKDKQVNRQYLYRILGYGFKEGVILRKPPTLKDVTNHAKGPMARRLSLTNPAITNEEWEEFVSKFRLFYQYKKEYKNKQIKPKTIKEKLESSSAPITTGFAKERENPNKQFIEDYFLKAIKQNLGGNSIPCFTLTGPDYNRHMTKLFNTIASKVTVAEIDKGVFDTIYNKAKICPYYLKDKVSLLNCNIDDVSATNCYFMDLDLMGNIVTIYNTVLKQIKIQSDSCNNNKLKYISFTASRRKDGGKKNRVKKLSKLLYEGFGTQLDGFRGGEGFGTGTEVFHPSKQLRTCKKHIPNITHYGRIKKIHVFTYQDRAPMMSLLIAYK